MCVCVRAFAFQDWVLFRSLGGRGKEKERARRRTRISMDPGRVGVDSGGARRGGGGGGAQMLLFGGGGSANSNGFFRGAGPFPWTVARSGWESRFLRLRLLARRCSDGGSGHGRRGARG